MPMKDSSIATPPPNPSNASPEAVLVSGLKLFFSWVILMPIAVIVSGKLLSQRFSLSGTYDDIFRIRIIGVLKIQATNQEVFLGFAGFLLTLLMVGGLFGSYAYSLFILGFGIDPGQFNTLCILSSMLTVLWASLIYLLTLASPTDPSSAERDRIVSEIAERTDVNAHRDAAHD